MAKSPHPPFGHLTPIRKGEREKAEGEAPNLIIMPSLRLPLGKWERLSDLSRLICKFQSCFSGFGIESDEKFMGESDTDDHFWFSLIDEALAKRGE